MIWLSNIKDKIKNNEDFEQLKSEPLRNLLSGGILTQKFLKRQYLLFALIALLAVFYIDNIFYCERQLKQEIDMQKKIKDVKFESLTVSAELMEISRQSHILEMIKERGLNLKVTEAPPVMLQSDTIVEN